MFKMSPFIILCGIGVLAVFSSTISKNPALPLLVTHIGGDQIAVGFIAGVSAFTGILIAVSKPVLGRFSDRHGRPPQIIWGTFIAGVCMLMVAFSFSFLTLLASSIVLGLSISTVTSASAAYIADLSKEGNYGSAMGMLGSIMDIGHTLGPITGGVLAVSFSLTHSFLSGTIILFFSTFCFIYLHQPKN